MRMKLFNFVAASVIAVCASAAIPVQYQLKDGFSVCGGLAPDGWYAGVWVLDDVDSQFRFPEDSGSYEPNNGNARRWQKAVAEQPRRILLVRPDGAQLNTLEIGSAERIDGPVCPKENVASPVLSWTERRNGNWALRLHVDGKTRTVLCQKGVLRAPRVAMTSAGAMLACERELSLTEGEVLLLTPDGTEVLKVPGRNPGLAAFGKGVALLTEACTPNAISLVLRIVENGKVVSTTEIRHHESDYTFNADVAGSGNGDALFVVAECSPAFGQNSELGLHREIRVWECSKGASRFVGSALPVERRGFKSLGSENLPPVQPRLLIENGKPAVVFKQFRYCGTKTFGWDVFWCKWDGTAWSQPVRLSPSQALPDTGYCVLRKGDTYVAMFPSLENKGVSRRSEKHRLEILEFDKEYSLDRFEVPEKKQHDYSVPAAYKDIVLQPPVLPHAYPGRTLIWGDMHVHSCYSKCVGSVDGMPDENLRYVRDVLGCKAIMLSEHTHLLSTAEMIWCLDRLEIQTGDHGILLYAREANPKDGHHTNTYAKDRDIFRKLHCLLETHRNSRQDAYRAIREDLPQGSVFAMRHFHGNAVTGDAILASFDPQLEIAMEAMQGRCNALVRTNGLPSAFPSAFLNYGCKVGLVGGTDHYREGPNHFCLTGFWVKEETVDGVWEAIRNHYTTAMSNGKVAMVARMKGRPAGSSFQLPAKSEVRIGLSASCGRKIRRAALIRDGVLLPWVDVNAQSATLELVDPSPEPGYHWYVPTLETDTAYGKDCPGYCHTSPFYVAIQ